MLVLVALKSGGLPPPMEEEVTANGDGVWDMVSTAAASPSSIAIGILCGYVLGVNQKIFFPEKLKKCFTHKAFPRKK